jgi:hypothetical protein
MAARRRRAREPGTPLGRVRALSIAMMIALSATPFALAGPLSRGEAAVARGDYIRAARELSPLAERGNAKALGLLGFLYEHGFGEPQAYEAAADTYARGAAQGNPFAQAMLGLLYDKGHGVPLDFVLAYKWLDLAAVHARGRERETFVRLRDAVASKMSTNEIVEGQRLAVNWAPTRFEPSLRANRDPLRSRRHFQ